MNEGQRLGLDNELEKLLNSNLILREQDKEKLNTVIGEVQEFYKVPVPKDKEEREKVYGEYREKIMEYGSTLASVKYNFQLTRDEYLFAKDVIYKRLEYNREDIFVALVCRDEFFRLYDGENAPNKTDVKFDKVGDKSIGIFPVNINDLTRISHLMGMYTVKDISSNKADYFASLIKKIGDVSKIFNYFKIEGEKLQKSGDNWVKGFEKYDTEELGEDVVEATPTEV